MKRVLLLLTILLASCATPPPEGLVVKSVVSSEHCPVNLAAPYPALRFYESLEQLSLFPEAASLLDGGRFDRTDDRLILIDRGQQRSAGYGMQLLGWNWDDGLVLQVAFAKPAAGGFVAQVLTRPCLLLTLRGYGGKQLRVIDTQGRDWPVYLR